jgi:hypothetical protein
MKSHDQTCFRHGDATIYTDHAPLSLPMSYFLHRLFSQFGDIPLPARICDLTSALYQMLPINTQKSKMSKIFAFTCFCRRQANLIKDTFFHTLLQKISYYIIIDGICIRPIKFFVLQEI